MIKSNSLTAAALAVWGSLAAFAFAVPPKTPPPAVEARSGRPFALRADGQKVKAVALFFVVPDCPVADGYAPERERLRREYEGRGVRFAVVYTEPGIGRAEAARHAALWGWGGATIADGDAKLARWAGASVSPEAVVLGPDAKIVYRGRIDDRWQDFGKKRAAPSRRDLRLALDAALVGKPAPQRFTRAVGCFLQTGERTTKKATRE